MNHLQIARVAHEINKAYCEAIDDDSQVPWGEAPEWQRDSIVAGVAFHHAHPKATPEESHKEWLKRKVDEGWSYGAVKDVKKKEHPCFMPYKSLPVEHKVKDHIFRATVRSLLET